MTHQGTEQSGVISSEEFAIFWCDVCSIRNLNTFPPSAIYTTSTKEQVVERLKARDSQIRAERDAEVMELVDVLKELVESLRFKELIKETYDMQDYALCIRKFGLALAKANNVTSKHTKPKGE